MPKLVLTTDEESTLLTLHHDKGHVLMTGKHHPTLDKVIAADSRPITQPLYRGVSKAELDKLLAGKPLNMYQSFSERREVAARFGMVITLLPSPNAKALCYWQYMVDMYQGMSSVEYELEDGDFMTKGLREEAEWIVPFNVALTLHDKQLRHFSM